MSAAINISGIEAAREKLTNLAMTISGYGRTVVVGTRMPYAYGIETGRHRVSGRLARRAGGVHFLARAGEEVLGQLTDDLLRGLAQSASGKPRSGLGQVRRVARWIGRLARRYAPRQTGRLRRSIHTEVSRSDRGQR